MASVIRFHRTGGPEVLRCEEYDVAPPGYGEARVRHAAVGVNFNDIYFRSGLYPVALPSPLGRSAAGIVEELGAGVTDVRVGDRVAYASSPLGAYSSERIVDTRYLVPVPDGVGLDVAAASTMRGMTAAYLMRRIHPWRAGDSLVLHAAAGGTGLIVSQWARHLGLRVIGTVSSHEKAEIALEHGCEHVIVRGNADEVVEKVMALTGGRGVPVVLDGVGRSTFDASLRVLSRRGLFVSFGASSGPVPPIDAIELGRRGSPFFTRPALADYASTRKERMELAGEFFQLVESGVIRVHVHQRLALADCAQAHRALESGGLVGVSVLVP
ncbi:quinone oxidoreductase family protein [Pigmentiphaga kullae]|uniref:NADPH:quinone reductase-like Zn-dependent oxidoreductase n=1 Tax=Pigmentiphaga kullae TaxID=151784 RepID=A0A4Q7NEM3_9BURK|nr:quinone oxidoreductase [Pigmentiphaga kullae]RZS81582.1 NADPH:quinone reductase-like Zn-dependent oxidoreductase [Pigmentiphaga kullae]